MAKEPPLTFEKFSSYDQILGIVPFYDNFVIFFWKGALAEYFKTLNPYMQLRSVAPDLEGRLSSRISKLNKLNDRVLKPYNRDLYKAYRIMRRYVSSDIYIAIPMEQ